MDQKGVLTFNYCMGTRIMLVAYKQETCWSSRCCKKKKSAVPRENQFSVGKRPQRSVARALHQNHSSARETTVRVPLPLVGKGPSMPKSVILSGNLANNEYVMQDRIQIRLRRAQGGDNQCKLVDPLLQHSQVLNALCKCILNYRFSLDEREGTSRIGNRVHRDPCQTRKHEPES